MVLISYDTRGMRKFAGTKYYKQLKCFNVLISYDSKEMREFARTALSLATEIRLFNKMQQHFFNIMQQHDKLIAFISITL